MGWGSASRAASPQLERAAPKVAEAHIEVEDVLPPSKEHEAEMAWMKERSRWASETANAIVTDFVRSQGLFSALVKFSKQRRR